MMYECLLAISSSKHHAPACVVLVSDCCLLATDDMMRLLLLYTQGCCNAVYMMLSNLCTSFVFCPVFCLFPTHPLFLPRTSFSSSYVCLFYFFFSPPSLTSLLPAGQGIAPSVMAPLPKRAALEKANGASAMFNTGMLQYQQALASMQFQQQAAFLPSGMAPKATIQRMPGSV